jgi:two-component system, OmpR family, alkaline phosphatase synthesis response regulator PhoP
MAKRILVVEDEEALCLTLGDRLHSEGYLVDFAKDGAAGIDKLSTSSFDLAIIDVMLPVRSGLDLCSEARRAGINIPIIMLTAKSGVTDRIVGLKMGADDYVCKPFDTAELMARIEAQLRRSLEPSGAEAHEKLGVFRFGKLLLDSANIRVTRDGNQVSLTAKEFQLLHYLASHRGKTISREELLLKVWDQKAATQTRTVDMHIAALRQKVEQTPKQPELILTVPGFGYRLANDAELAS